MPLPLLLVKAWFDNPAGNEFYLENLGESQQMNEIVSGLEANTVSYFVQAPSSNLPVEMLSFDAKVEGQAIQLDWATAQEYNNAGFEIERSLDAQSFSSIGWVEGAGTSAQVKSYRFTDRDLVPAQTYYYRLRQVDVNGIYTYSNTREARLAQDESLFISNCYPNPAPGYSEVKLTAVEACRIGWKLYNAMGHELHQGEVDLPPRTAQHFKVPLQGLSAGTYVLNFFCEGKIESRRLIVL